jgi:hypothetical protein
MVVICADFCAFSLFAWHMKASPANATCQEQVQEDVRKISREYGFLSIETALMSSALADGKSSICIGGSLFKLDATAYSKPRIELLKLGLFDGAVSPSGEQFVSFGPEPQPISGSHRDTRTNV